MTKQELVTLIVSKHNPELAKLSGMVHQVWEDGEHTCQKSGDLLWQRTLHMFEPAIEGFVPDCELMPVQSSGHAYCYCTDEDAKIIRQAMLDYTSGV